MHTLTVPASMEYLDEVMETADRILTEAGCGEDEKRLIEISLEELFTNIASYAYGSKAGRVWVGWDIRDMGGHVKEAEFCFQDEGTPYNPFTRKDPDLELPIEERPVGGLGIYMTKKFMDDVKYKYENGRNVTRISKRFSGRSL